MRLRLLHTELSTIELRTRMPFRYGIAVMTQVPQAFVRLWLDVDGTETAGISSDCLPPKWFTKVPEKPIDEEVKEMLTVIRHAMAASKGLEGATVFDIWRQLYDAQTAWSKAERIPPLLANFGTSLVERAIIDAFCRYTKIPFWKTLRTGGFGIRLDELHSGLGAIKTDDFLPGKPLARAIARHTVGLGDPLRDENIPLTERLSDGLPQSLAACIKAYGLQHFKVKVSGKMDQDLPRLKEIAGVLKEFAPSDFGVTLDGNEQFKSVEEFKSFWSRLRAELKDFAERILFVEQPLHRDVALLPEVGEALRRWPSRPPLIIDESDATLKDCAMALELGYAGTSHKNCKGVFKGIANLALLTHEGQRKPKSELIMSGEDLCTIGPVALLQDLAVMAALGIRSVERNGHHYHAGLSQLPRSAQEAMLSDHADLYRPSAAGWPTLRIAGGEVALESINNAPFGVSTSPGVLP